MSRAADELRVGIVTLFPELFGTFFRTSFMKRAIAEHHLFVHLENLREHGIGRHRSVDDTPYGGGAGMVMRVDCVAAALDHTEKAGPFSGPVHRVLLTPQGAPFRQATAERFVEHRNLVFLCGRYEGFDERVRTLVNEELSLGDFVMLGGEVAAMAVLETTTRLVRGVLGNECSSAEESFSPAQQGGLEYPQYTRPLEFRGLSVPEVLRSGDHRTIGAWRADQARQRTVQRRPDLVGRGGDG